MFDNLGTALVQAIGFFCEFLFFLFINFYQMVRNQLSSIRTKKEKIKKIQ